MVKCWGVLLNTFFPRKIVEESPLQIAERTCPSRLGVRRKHKARLPSAPHCQPSKSPFSFVPWAMKTAPCSIPKAEEQSHLFIFHSLIHPFNKYLVENLVCAWHREINSALWSHYRD